jgi:hypothetical protein
MRFLLAVAAVLLLAGVASAAEQPVRVTPNTEIRLIHWAHDGQIRPAWLFLPAVTTAAHSRGSRRTGAG